MIDGIWWLVILLVVIVALWLLAQSRGAKDDSKDKKRASLTKTPVNDALQKTLVSIKQYFPDYRVIRRGNHLLITRQDKKIAMITIDKNIAVGQRRLGEVPVINFHRAPSRTQLNKNLQDAE